MKSLFIDKPLNYDGTQLKSLFGYLEHGVMGDSIVSFIGACDISFDHMVDGEDLLQKAKICGSSMLHFIIEIFDEKLISGVTLQRLFASQARDYLQTKTSHPLVRQGDDIFWGAKKLSISIATSTPRSVMIHFAMNISNDGTPVETCALNDFGLSPTAVAKDLMNLFLTEFQGIREATWKVRGVDSF